jgi:hypothetical protein
MEAILSTSSWICRVPTMSYIHSTFTADQPSAYPAYRRPLILLFTLQMINCYRENNAQQPTEIADLSPQA